MSDYYYEEDADGGGGDEYDEPFYADDGQTIEAQGRAAFGDVLVHCCWPTIVQIVNHYLVQFIAWTLLYRCSVKLFKSSIWLHHITSIGCGLCLLLTLLPTIGIAYLLALTVVVYGIMYAVGQRRGPLVSCICFAFILCCELFATNEEFWHQIRGTQMIMVMKLISLAFDVDAGKVATVRLNALSFFGYLLCPANCVLGPWHSFGEYLTVTGIYWKWNLKWLLRIAANLTLALFFICGSNCLIAWLWPSDDPSFKWPNAVSDAMSFRYSHYFVSFLSQATMLMAGYGQTDAGCLGYVVTKPWLIEWPRSLVNVVVVWNVSMHVWLKMYVFRQIRPFGTVLAIFGTYIVSALLHGLNFPMAAVLLSLGLYTYVEHNLRTKLSIVYSACIMAQACRQQCAHVNKSQNLLVRLVNVSFSLLAVFHLAYLGVMFAHAAAAKLQDDNESFGPLDAWSKLNYLSHWTVAICYLSYLII